MELKNKNCIIIFVKNPEYGKVKSRLAKDIGETNALRLYECFIQDLLSLLSKSSYEYIIAFTPLNKESEIKNKLGKNYKYIPQRGNDLGDKMKNAFIDIFEKGFENVILIGSDSPDLKQEIFTQGFNLLKESTPVIGKTIDGGYYLIGFNKNNFLPNIFQGITWSTETVFEDTLKIFKENGKIVTPLIDWYDIDSFNDLKNFYKNNISSEMTSIKFIKKNNLI